MVTEMNFFEHFSSAGEKIVTHEYASTATYR